MPLTTPFNKVLCPYCFKKYYPGECAVISLKTRALLHPAPKGLKKAAKLVWMLQLGGDEIIHMPRLQCPGCQRPWPEDIEQAENHIIAVIGGVAAGISTYLAMAIHELTQNARVRQAIGVTKIQALSQEVEHQYHRQYDSLIKYTRVLPASRPLHPDEHLEPLIYRLDFPQNARKRKPVYLYFYDAANEDMLREERVLEYSRFLLHASGIILMADPLAMPNMRKRIHPQYHPSISSDRSPSDVLFQVLRLYEQRLRAKPTIPIAITISKSDMLQFADPQRRSRIFANPAYSDLSLLGPIRRQDLEEVGEDVKELLKVYGDEALLTWAEQYKKVGFFAVSATGYPPDTQTRSSYLPLEPMRVLDPVLWVLWQLGVIDVV